MLKFKLTITLLIMLFLIISCQDTNDISKKINIDTNIAVQIGNQVWLKKNLDVSHYRNGDEIPHITDSSEWNNLTTGAWCYLNNDSANNDKYGKLYNHYAVIDPRGLAPEGWRIPTFDDWNILNSSIEGDINKIKIKGVWMRLYHHGEEDKKFNETKFSAYPAGRRINEFQDNCALWWTTSKRYKSNMQSLLDDEPKSLLVGLDAADWFSSFQEYEGVYSIGASVRCVK